MNQTVTYIAQPRFSWKTINSVLRSNAIFLLMDSKLWGALLSFVLMCSVMIFFFPCSFDADSALGLTQYRAMFGQYLIGLNDHGLLAPVDEVVFRFCQVGITLLELLLLSLMRLVKRDSLGVYLIWPFTAYLATKVKIEFFLMPLCLIRTDLKWKTEGAVWCFLLIFLAVTGEHNTILLLMYRLLVLIFSHTKHKIKLFFLICLGAFCVDHYLFSLLSNYFSAIQKFQFARTIVNPTYSLVETIGVFIASLHLSVDPVGGWRLHIIFGLIVSLLLLFTRGIVNRIRSDECLSFISIDLLLTSLTHIFQNARYYLFFLPIFSEPIYRNRFLFFAILGWINVFSTIVYYNFVLHG